MTFAVFCPHCGAAQSVTQSTDTGGAEPPVVCFSCNREFVPSEAARTTDIEVESPSVDVFCPHCGASRSVVVDTEEDVEPPVTCFACGREFFASEAARPLPRAARPSDRRPWQRHRSSNRRNRRRSMARARARGPARLLSLVAACQLAIHVVLLVIVIWNLIQPVGSVNAQEQERTVLMGCAVALFVLKDAVVLLGMNAMQRQHHYPLACAAAVCALIPDGCWLVSVAFGIWALVVLTDQDVRASFAWNPPVREERTPHARADEPDAAPARSRRPFRRDDERDEEWLADARAAVRAPATLLFVAWLAGACVTLVLVSVTAFSVAQGNAAGPGAQAERPALVAYSIIAVVVTTLGLAGAWSALRLRRRGLAIISSVLMCVCFLGCLVGLGIGIWSLTVFLRRDVARAFAGTTGRSRSDHRQEPYRPPSAPDTTTA